MATIRGEKVEIKPGLYGITREAEGGGKLLALFNETDDAQFNVCYTLTGTHSVQALGTTQVSDECKYAICVYPGETVEFFKGKWGAFKRSVSFGAPDKTWQDKQTKVRDKVIEDEIAAIKELVKQNPKADGKYTAEYIASLCEQHKIKFVDLTFPPRQTTIARDWEPPVEGTYSWMRPPQYCPKTKPPAIFVGDIEPNDIDQGVLGDCYFLCALACVSEFPLLIRDAFSLPQNPELGIYRVLMCKNGWWQVVIVDDYLPTSHGIPCFARNREEPNELWVALFEKAYAKLHGSYSAIRSGDTAQSTTDVLGAPYKKFKQLPEYEDKSRLWQLLKQSDENDFVLSLSTPKGTEEDRQRYAEVGLPIDHAFSLLRVKEVKGHQLCMIRNPWGDEKEWTGAWSDDSNLWTPELQKAVGFYKGNDGTFWMAWGDVIKYFDNGTITDVFRDWPQLRVPANWDAGTTDLVVLLNVKKKVRCYFSCHQRDNRGLPAGDKDLKYVGMLIAVLNPSDNGTGPSAVVAQSNQGAYSDVRDMSCSVTLEPQDKPYAVLVQPFDGTVAKSFTIAIILEDPSAFTNISFVTYPSPSAKKRYQPVNKFLLSDWPQKAMSNYQIRMATRTKEGMELHSRQGDCVDLKLLSGQGGSTPAAGASGPAISAVKPAGAIAPAKTAVPEPAKMAPGPSPSLGPGAKAPVAAPAAAKPEEAPGERIIPPQTGPKKGELKFQLIVLAGRNLVAKDSNGLSDPYVTVKLKTPTGARISNDQRQETRYIKETLNPVWCEVFNFYCAPTDNLCIKVWDKDLFGHDAMGELNMPIRDALKGLEPGGSAKMEWFKLKPPPDDACGEIQLAFAIQL